MRSDNNCTCYASCSFGLEKIVALELEALGLKEIRIKAAPEAEAPTYVFAATLAKKKK